MGSIRKLCERMHYYCVVASVGYDWDNRWDVYDGGEGDCSSLTITCLREAGFDTGNAVTTHNMSSELCARGWERLSPDLSQARPGDILLNDQNHVCVVVDGYGWNATIAQASIGETGGVYGNQPGDQTGWETNERAIYDYPWDCILRWGGADEVDKWVKADDGRWWYRYADGTYPKSDWKYIDGKWYYFDSEGWMATGWVPWSGGWYYCDEKDGYMRKGWLKLGGKKYWCDSTGRMATGFRTIKGAMYLFDKSGALVTDASRIKIGRGGKIRIA